MRPGAFLRCATWTVVPVIAFLFAACGSDKAAPTDPATTSTIPDIVFFNTNDLSNVVLFEGRATDNTRVEEVLISFDNGAVWHTADIDNSPPNKLYDVAWSYLAEEADIPATMNTLLIKASDADANEVISSPIPFEKKSGSGVGDLETLFSGAADGQVIALSSGIGGAYGNGATALSIPIDVGLTVLGSGYGDTVTSGGLIPIADPTATILESAPASAGIFSVDADLILKNIRLVGAETAVRIFDDAGPDPRLSVEDCLFDKQSAWALYADDDDGNVALELISSIVDASTADSSAGSGGLYLRNVVYEISGSEIYLQSLPGTGAGVLAVGSSGTIDTSIFDGNATGVWASGGAAVITSSDFSNIFAAAYTTNGINLTGGPGSALIRRNTIDGNSGYGLRVGGKMELTLRKNAITDNGLSGVLIDSTLSNTNLNRINMGTTNDPGNNLFDGNVHPQGAWGQDTQVFVTLATSEGSTRIPANWNYWGVAIGVNLVIIDGIDDAARATVAIGSFWPSINSEVGP